MSRARDLAAAVSLSLLLVSSLPLAASTASQTPRALVQETEKDLGTLVHGERVSTEFTVENTGSAPLALTSVSSSCGCTVVDFDRTISPGESGTITAEVDTSRLMGPITAQLIVETNEPDAEPIQLKVKAVVDTLLHAVPGYARWIYVQHEPEGTISQTIWSKDGRSFDVRAVEAPAPYIDVSFHEATADEREEDKPGSQWIVAATLDAEAPVGPLSGSLEIQTDHPKQTSLSIPVSGFVRPTLFISPESGDLGTIEVSEPTQTAFTVRNFASDPIAITEAETSIDGIESTVEPIEEGRRYRVVLEFDPSTIDEGPFAGELTLRTDHREIPELRKELSGTVVLPERTAGTSTN